MPSRVRARIDARREKYPETRHRTLAAQEKATKKRKRTPKEDIPVIKAEQPKASKVSKAASAAKKVVDAVKGKGRGKKK